jgi:GntR family transcriptional regulator/MocR family aminotransferase
MTTLLRAHNEVPVVIKRGGPVPLAAQIAAELRQAVADGRLGAGERISSSRALAASLRVSRTVVTSAYAQLYAEGWLDGRHGSGTFVAAGALRPPGADTGAGVPAWSGGTRTLAGPGAPGWPGAAGRPGAKPLEMRPGIPWAAGIEAAAWRRAWRLAGAVPPSASPEPLGLEALRVALGSHLRLSRAIRCTPDQILVTRGVAGSLRLLAAALLQPGDRVAMEDPGYPAARAVFAAHGAQVAACPADEHGLVVSALPADVRMVYTTPAHQYPLGGRLPVPRRQALIAWARSTGALIVEDDYDSEFRYDVAPLPALFGLDQDVVVYLGTTSKTLTPALGVGWLAARPGLVAGIAAAAAELGERVSEAAQRAFLALIASGDLGRHVRRMRREYGRRRAAIVAALGAVPGPARLLGDTAGLHVVLELPEGTADQLAAAALERGVAAVTLQRYFAGQATRDGLMLGYGGASLSQVEDACKVLGELVAALPAG